MKITQLIELLETKLADYGDLEITVCDTRDEYFDIEPIDLDIFGNSKLVFDFSDKNM